MFKIRIFKPLGITDTTFELTDPMRRKLAGIRARNAVGSLTPMNFERPAKPEVHMGRHRVYGTVGDHMRFIRDRTLLADAGPVVLAAMYRASGLPLTQCGSGRL